MDQLVDRRRSVSAHVQAYGRQAIVRAELRPRCQRSENGLATWISVSRTQIREVLLRLREELLVEIVPQLRRFVSRISPREVAEAQPRGAGERGGRRGANRSSSRETLLSRNTCRFPWAS